MKFFTTSKPITALSGDAIVVFCSPGESGINASKEFILIDQRTKGLCTSIIKEQKITGKMGSICVLQTRNVLPYKNVFVVGLGEEEKIASDWQYIFACIARKAKQLHCTSLIVPTNRLQDAVIGLGLGSYTFLIHKNKKIQKEDDDIKQITFVTNDSLQQTKEEITKATIAVEATTFVRDLVNEPSSVTTPSYLAKVARKIAKTNPSISCKVLSKNDMKRLGMYALLAVAQGSYQEPKFVQLTYRHGRGKTVTLVGKGITYDSGGLSLKPQSGLETMKCDMAGAASILGVFSALSSLKPKGTIVGLLAFCENMPGGEAVKPGDVITALNGKTIEIINTDAEGRVILADALAYAEKYVKSDVIIDLATLTGACVVALGEEIAGVFTDDASLAETLLSAASVSGEKLWRLPIVREYEKQLKSDIADVRNVSKTRYGGAINGALFLKEFVPNAIPWAHLDIAGPAFAEHDMTIAPYGGTGFSVRTLLSFIAGQEEKTRR